MEGRRLWSLSGLDGINVVLCCAVKYPGASMLLSNSLRILDEHEEETILLISNVVVLPYENGESHFFARSGVSLLDMDFTVISYHATLLFR